MVELARRSFLVGLGAALVTAPAIVRATSIMPVKKMAWSVDDIAALLDARLDQFTGEYDPAIYKRYAGYEAVEFDPERHAWLTEQEYSGHAIQAARAGLVTIQAADSRRWERLLVNG